MEKLLIVISSPSGGGKTTICKRLISDELSPIANKSRFSISATTRQKRGNEENGKDYYFFTKEEFNKRLESNEFLEYALVFGNLYGTLKSEVKPDFHTIFDIDIAGFNQIKQKTNVLSFFLLPPSIEVLAKRLESRGDLTPEDIEKRLKEGKNEIKEAHKYDFIFVNNSLDRTFASICDVISSYIFKQN